MSEKQPPQKQSGLKKEAKPSPPSRPRGTRLVLNHVIVDKPTHKKREDVDSQEQSEE